MLPLTMYIETTVSGSTKMSGIENNCPRQHTFIGNNEKMINHYFQSCTESV